MGIRIDPLSKADVLENGAFALSWFEAEEEASAVSVRHVGIVGKNSRLAPD